MKEKQNRQKSEAEAELEREIREGRKFSLEEAIGRMAGPGAMKGESPVSRLQQADFEIAAYLRSHLPGAGGALQVVLHRDVTSSDLLLNNSSRPLVILAEYCQRVLDSDYLLQELVRSADIEWGRILGERPYFNKEGVPSHPDDPYTPESVRQSLIELLNKLIAENET